MVSLVLGLLTPTGFSILIDYQLGQSHLLRAQPIQLILKFFFSSEVFR